MSLYVGFGVLAIFVIIHEELLGIFLFSLLNSLYGLWLGSILEHKGIYI